MIWRATTWCSTYIVVPSFRYDQMQNAANLRINHFSPLFSRYWGQPPASFSVASDTRNKCHSFRTHDIAWCRRPPEYSLCSSAGQPPCSLCALMPLFAGKLVPGSAKLEIITQRQESSHLESVVAFLDCISSLLLGSCVGFSTSLFVTDAVATIAEMRLNAN